MYAFYICLVVYLVFIYYERIKCIYIFSIYINMWAAVGPTYLSGRVGPKHVGHPSPYLSISGPLNGPCRPGPVTDRAGPCLDRAKFVSCHGPNGRLTLFGHLYAKLAVNKENQIW